MSARRQNLKQQLTRDDGAEVDYSTSNALCPYINDSDYYQRFPPPSYIDMKLIEILEQDVEQRVLAREREGLPVNQAVADAVQLVVPFVYKSTAGLCVLNKKNAPRVDPHLERV